MQFHELKRKNPNKKSIKVGRGGKRGKTSGKGMKGQKARAGNSTRPEIRDMIKKLPKLRGRGVNSNTSRLLPKRAVNLSVLNENFKDGDRITPIVLLEKGLIKKVQGKVQEVKILGTGEIDKKLTIRNCAVSKTAAMAIEKAGGKIE